MIYILLAFVIVVAFWTAMLWATWAFFAHILIPTLVISMVCVVGLWVKYRLTGRL